MVRAESLQDRTTAVEADLARAIDPQEWPHILLRNIGNEVRWRGPYARDSDLRDDWGHPFRRVVSGIYSFGRNGVDDHGGVDDLSTWGRYDHASYPSNLCSTSISPGTIVLTALVLMFLLLGLIGLPAWLFFRRRKT